MKGLILKDILNLRRQYKLIVVLFGFYFMLSVTSGNSAVMGGVIALMTVMLTITSMSYDEYSKWDKYALTMPLSRFDIVLSKYILGLILSVVALVINLLLMMFASDVSAKEAVIVSFSLFGIGLLFLSLILPFMFYFGVEKGRLVMMLILFVPTGIVLLLANSGMEPPSFEYLDKLAYYIPFLVILLLIISIIASCKIYFNKEL